MLLPPSALCFVMQWSPLPHSITAISIATTCAVLKECQVVANLLGAESGSEMSLVKTPVVQDDVFIKFNTLKTLMLCTALVLSYLLLVDWIEPSLLQQKSKDVIILIIYYWEAKDFLARFPSCKNTSAKSSAWPLFIHWFIWNPLLETLAIYRDWKYHLQLT